MLSCAKTLIDVTSKKKEENCSMNIRLVHICTEIPELLNTRVIRCAVYPDSLNNFITV